MESSCYSQSFQSVNGEVVSNTIKKTLTNDNNQPLIHYEMEIFPGESPTDLNSGFIEFDILNIEKLSDINLKDEMINLLDDQNLDIIVTQIDKSHDKKIEYLLSCGFTIIEDESNELDENIITLMFSEMTFEETEEDEGFEFDDDLFDETDLK